MLNKGNNTLLIEKEYTKKKRSLKKIDDNCTDSFEIKTVIKEST